MTDYPDSEWRPIADLSEEELGYSNDELRGLESVWREQKGALEESGHLKSFGEKLKRRWAIETGVIERVYDLDRGVTELLIEQGINVSLLSHSSTGKDPELVVAMIRDHEAAIDTIFDYVAKRRPLSISYVKELHALFTRNQDTTSAKDAAGKVFEVKLLKGEFKKLPNNPTREDGSTHYYCPPEQTDSEMERLIALHLEHTELGVQSEVEAAWLHHRFAQIHPFQDGNGRVARALSSMVFIRGEHFPLTILRDDRVAYIDALEEADRGDLTPLIGLFSKLQKRTLIKALSLAEEEVRGESLDQLIDAVKTHFSKRDAALAREWERAKETAAFLLEEGYKQIGDVSRKLGSEIGSIRCHSRIEAAGGKCSHYYRLQVVNVANKLDYFANLREHHGWVRMTIEAEAPCFILLSIHGLGQEYRGMLAATVCFFQREEDEDGKRHVSNLVPISDELFQINYREDQAVVAPRFKRWLDENVLKALGVWRAGLE